MIEVSELRTGNTILQKVGSKISRVSYSIRHAAQIAAEGTAAFYPVVLKADVVEKAGFTENKQYALLPEARHFILTLPVQGGGSNEIHVYQKNNGECFGRATVNAVVASTNFYQLHQLQNLYYALTGMELVV